MFGFIKKIGSFIMGGSNGKSVIGEVVDTVGDTVQSFNPEAQATKRQSNDLLSDNQLSKSIRPVAIIWILTLFTASLIANWCGLKTDDKFQELIFWALITCLGFYFPGRVFEKYIQNKKTK